MDVILGVLDGVFVFFNVLNFDFVIGDLVLVMGLVSEYFG